jgi:hypothetical protein
MMIRYNRRSLCAGDDVYNGIYDIEMPDDAVLKDLIEILIYGGNGNDWPLAHNHDGWLICSDIGGIAHISGDLKEVQYCDADRDTGLSVLGISWVFGEYEGADPDDTRRRCRYLFEQD